MNDEPSPWPPKETPNPRIEAERARRKRRWPAEFADGERCAFHNSYPGKREPGGYPLGFHGRPLERRNAWYCGYNFGLIERQRALMEAR